MTKPTLLELISFFSDKDEAFLETICKTLELFQSLSSDSTNLQPDVENKLAINPQTVNVTADFVESNVKKTQTETETEVNSNNSKVNTNKATSIVIKEECFTLRDAYNLLIQNELIQPLGGKARAGIGKGIANKVRAAYNTTTPFNSNQVVTYTKEQLEQIVIPLLVQRANGSLPSSSISLHDLLTNENDSKLEELVKVGIEEETPGEEEEQDEVHYSLADWLKDNSNLNLSFGELIKLSMCVAQSYREKYNQEPKVSYGRFVYTHKQLETIVPFLISYMFIPSM